MGLNVIAHSLGNPSMYSNSEGFRSHEEESSTAGAIAVLVAVLIFIVQVIIVAFFGKWIWNYAIAGKDGLFPFVREVDSIWQLIGIFIIVQLFSM
jgi:hypothetical protein